MAMAAPSPDQSNYSTRTMEFVRATVPQSWHGKPVQFFATLTGNGPDLWGMPTSAPAPDPRNPDFVYQRFQNGILMYDAVNGTTAALPLGEYLKDVLTGQNLPADLAEASSGSPLLGQYAPSQPLSLLRPTALIGTDLSDAFTPDDI